MLGLLEPIYLWIKAGHIISVISWMAALFYLPRLYVYHTESGGGQSVSHDLFTVMERRLLQIIATPAMILSWLFGLLLLMVPGTVDWGAVWIYVKVAAVLAMTWFHMWLAGRRHELLAGTCQVTAKHFRKMNEVPTVLMLVIVVMVIVRPF